MAIPKIEVIVNRATKYDVKLEKSKLTYAHKDPRLEEVKRRVSAKIFALFYQNYV